MKVLAMLLAPALLLAMSHAAESRDEERPPIRFPELKASNLEKREFTLPQDFEGERNLVLIAFEREQQKDLDTWLREMKRFQEIDPGFAYYELPTISRLNAFSRWFIDSGMRRGIPDKSARGRTITLYLDKNPFKEALGINSEKQVYALLVDKSGNILWRTEGTFDEQKAESLRNAFSGAAW
jgi:hypothetical protein